MNHWVLERHAGGVKLLRQTYQVADTNSEVMNARPELADESGDLGLRS